MKRGFPTSLALLFLGLSAAAVVPGTLPPAAAETAAKQPVRSFASPDEAVAAFVDALRKSDLHALYAVLGPGSGPLINSGDRVADEAARNRFLASYDARHALVADARGRMVLHVGDNDWPLPLPIVRKDGRWHFDSRQGAEQLVDRRIGENEIAAIRTTLAVADAQKAYFEMTRASGTGEYAQRIHSTPGHHDGLYWQAAEGEPESPLAPLVESAEEEGYPGANVSGKPVPYHGYFFRILKAQGPYAPEGAMSYLDGEHMTKGFALLAWPARYGVSGIMSFEVDQSGVVFQKDLGPDTEKLARAISAFDPDLSWARVDVVAQ